MARASDPSRGRLEESMALLLLAQAQFVARASETDCARAKTWRRMDRTKQRMDETQRRMDERCARIEALLLENNRLARALVGKMP